MVTKIVTLILVISLMAAAAFLSVSHLEPGVAEKIIQSMAVIAMALIVDILAQRYFLHHIPVQTVRFIASKVTGYVTYVIAIMVAMAIWIEQAQTLLFAVGIIGAGIAIALQRPVTSIVGFMILLVLRPYSTGDRIEIDGEAGDVIDVDIFYTKLMEIGEWTRYDQYTGRVKTIPNYFVLEKAVNNYSKDFGFIWEEMMMPVTYGSDIRKAREIMLRAAEETTRHLVEQSKKELHSMTYRYLFEPRDVNPAVYIIPTDDWVELRLRFVVDAKHRRTYVNPIFERILDEFMKAEGITISSRTTARIWDSTRKKGRY